MRKTTRKSLIILLCAAMVINTPSYAYAAPESEEKITASETDETEKVNATEAETEETRDLEEENTTSDADVISKLADGVSVAAESDDIEVEAVDNYEEYTKNLRDTSVLVPYMYGEIDDFADDYVPTGDEIAIESDFPSKYAPTDSLMNLRNQGNYGTCWAHAAMACAEANMVLQGKASADSVDYSERAIAYFLNGGVNLNDPLGNTDGDTNFRTDSIWASGSNAVYVARFLSGWRTVLDESKAPYSGLPSTVDVSKAYDNEAVLTDCRFYSNSDRASIKAAIMNNGLVTCDYTADLTSSCYNRTYNSYYVPNAYNTNHEVAIVGWDDDFSAANFSKTPEGDGAWLIRNSWGSGKTYSYNGYFWLSYYDKTLANITSYSFVAPDDFYDNNYFYDGGAAYFGYGSSNKASGANVFKAKANDGEPEVLKAVSFVTQNTNVNYTVDIYLDPVTDASGVVKSPVSGTKVESATTTGMTSHAGIYSVPLSSPVVLSPGQLFSVVVTYEKQGENVYMEYEFDFRNYYSSGVWFTSTTAVEPGQSFMGRGSSYYDMTSAIMMSMCRNGGNIRIKAFTDNQEVPHSAISYELYGGTNNADNPSKYTHASDFTLLDPVRSGYTFEGWFTDGEFTNQITKLTTDMPFGNYTLHAKWSKGKVPTPTSSVPGGEVNKNSTVQLSSSLEGASIYYTIDGSDPDPENVYSSNNTSASTYLYDDCSDGIIIDHDMTIKAMAVKAEYYNSDIMTVSYTAVYVEDWGDILVEDRADFSSPEDVPYAYWVTGISNAEYCGTAVTFPDIHVYYHDVLLKEKTDYSVKYANNLNAGVAKITFTFCKNFSGTLQKTFTISPLDIAGANVQDITLAATGSAIKGKSPVTYVINGKTVTLKEGTDYTLSYGETRTGAYKVPNEDSDPGYTVTVIGKKNYIGTTQFKEIIVGKNDIAKATFKAIPNQNYNDGQEITPEVTVSWKRNPLTMQTTENGTGDYKVEYINNVYPGTASVKITGVNDFTGTKILNFKIKGASLTPLKLKCFAGSREYTKITDCYYTGGHLTPSFELYKTINKQDIRLKGISAEDYETASPSERAQYSYVYTYSNNVNAGTATVLCTGINGYEGTYKTTFKIVATNITDTTWVRRINGVSTNSKIELDIDQQYNYSKAGAKPMPTVWYRIPDEENGGYTYKKLALGTDYTLSYEDNKKVGTAYVKITGKGSYKGTIKVPYLISHGEIDADNSTASDITYKLQANICKPVITVVDTNGVKLSAGTDYNKVINYYYDEDVTVQQFTNVRTKTVTSVSRSAGESVSVNDIIPAGTVICAKITGVNNYAGSEATIKFGVAVENISSAKVKIDNQLFTGRAITLNKNQINITVKGIRLESSEYDIVSYSKNIAKGTATVVLRGKGNYGGLKSATFKIVAR